MRGGSKIRTHEYVGSWFTEKINSLLLLASYGKSLLAQMTEVCVFGGEVSRF